MFRRINQRTRSFFAWPQHKFAWFIGAVFSLALVLIIVPGEPTERTIEVNKPSPLLIANPLPMGRFLPPTSGQWPGPHLVEEYCHGWPLQFLRRANGFGGSGWTPQKRYVPGQQYVDSIYLPIWCIERDAWPFSSDKSEWRISALLIDILVAALIVMAAVRGAEYWISSRKSLFRLRLVDLLVLTMVLALVLGWRQWHLSHQQFESSWSSTFKHELGEGYPVRNGAYTNFTPVWLRRLLGTEWLTPWCGHYTRLRLPAEITEEQFQAISAFRYLDDVEVVGMPSQMSLDYWSKLMLPKRFRIGCDYNKVEDPTIDFASLAALPELYSVDVHCPNVLIEDLVPLVKSQSLRMLRLSYATVTRDEANEFQEQYSPDFELAIEKPVRRMFGEPQEATMRDSARVRLARWRNDESYDWQSWGRGETIDLDFSKIEVTTERLRRLLSICKDVDDLRFGKVADVEGIREFILACQQVNSLDLGGMVVTDEILAELHRLEELEELVFRQSHVSVQVLKDLVKIPKLRYVEVLASDLTPEQVAEVEDFHFRTTRRQPDRDLFMDVYYDVEGEKPISGVVEADKDEHHPFSE